MLTEPQKKRQYDTNDERVFLAQQAADAKTAMQHTVTDMQATAKEVANISWWTQQYPWYAVGAATVLGFVAATSVLAPADQCLPVPPSLTMVEAAALPETLFTVWTNLFERGWASEGEAVLVHGGTSGIGTMSIALGRLFGLTVIVTCGSKWAIDASCCASS